MRRSDILATIEAVHAAGLDTKLWPAALDSIKRAVGGHIATLEAFERTTLEHHEFLAHGLPPPGQVEYLEHYAALNVRLPAHRAAKCGEIIYDYGILDETAMRNSPFYAEFLPRLDLRYFISGIIATSEQEFTALTVQRSARQGHVDRADIALMRQIVPHVQQAFDVTRRLKGTTEDRRSLERTLDWLTDGVALLRTDGTVAYANESFQAIARRGDALRLRRSAIEFLDGAARDKFDAAVASVVALAAGKTHAASAADFVAARSTAGPPYLVSVRAIFERPRHHAPLGGIAIVFIRDPQARGGVSTGALRQLFALTEAEAALAQALQSGVTLAVYARQRSLSLNTVYTHLRRLREKTGCSRMPELIRKLNDLQVPLRIN